MVEYRTYLGTFGEGRRWTLVNKVIVSNSLFFSFLALGTFVTLFTSSLLESFGIESATSASKLVPTLFVISIIILYYLTGNLLLVKTFDVSREKFADSIYFMGFMFTLITLTVSLFWVGESTDSSTTGQIIQKNAIALVTTVVGLGIRILLVQFQDDNDYYDAYRRSLRQRNCSPPWPGC